MTASTRASTRAWVCGLRPGPFPVPEQWAGAAHARRQLQLHAAASGQVDRVPRVKAAQLDGDGVDVGDHLVCR